MPENKTCKADNDDENEGSRGKVTIPKILTYDEIDRLLLATDNTEDLLAARIMLFAGLRVGEVASLKVKDVDAERCAVFVEQGKGDKDRYAPCDIATISAARCYSRGKAPDSPLFQSSKRTIQRHMEDDYKKAGITWGATCHTLRHTCATWQLDKGIPLEAVRENLGHEDIAVTQVYLHLNIRQRSRTYREVTRFGV